MDLAHAAGLARKSGASSIHVNSVSVSRKRGIPWSFTLVPLEEVIEGVLLFGAGVGRGGRGALPFPSLGGLRLLSLRTGFAGSARILLGRPFQA